MLSVAEATAAVLSHARPLPPTIVALSEAHGMILAEDVVSDIDSPPHDKSMVDGYAVVVMDLANGPDDLTVIEEVTAGEVPKKQITPGHAARIMTGAPIPVGAEAVVMVEKTATSDDDRVRILESPVRSAQNILRRGVSMQAGETVLRAGHELRAAEIGLLAEIGNTRVLVSRRPTVAILSTGNELVPADQRPGPGQIRNSNGPMLAAAAARCGATVSEIGIVHDERAALRAAIRLGLESDVLILSGGVSTGVLDLVPAVLRDLGVQEVFHKVRVKPGKPIWFGVLTLDQQRAAPTLVFGLVGNPVGSLAGFELFVRPALRRLAGQLVPDSPTIAAALTEPFLHKGDRPTYHPGVLTSGSTPTVAPLKWKGSADLRTVVDANCLIVFPAGDRAYQAGEIVVVRNLE